MLFKIITVALLGFSLGGVDAAGFVYQTYTSIGQDYLNTAVPIKLNAVAYQSNAANCRYECDLVETCVGAIFFSSGACDYMTREGSETALRINPTLAANVMWKYDVSVGPSCSSVNDFIASIDGSCQCKEGTDIQDTAVGCKAIPEPAYTYVSYALSNTEGTPLAGFVDPITQAPGEYTLDGCRYTCDEQADCIGYLYQTSGGACTTMRQGTTNNAAGSEFNLVSWKFNVAVGPVCDYETNGIAPSGQCVCDSQQVQDTAFGCLARLAPSQAFRRRALKKRIAPGVVQKASFA